MRIPKGIAEIEWWLNKKRISEHKDPRKRHKSYYVGVSQGSSISPLLSTLVLTHPLLTHPTNKNLQYADDGLLYGETLDLSVLTFPPESGIRINENKSGWVRKKGQWEKPLTFLGTVFVPKELLVHIPPALTKGGVLISKNSAHKEMDYINWEGYRLAAVDHLKTPPLLRTEYAKEWRKSVMPLLGEWSDIHLTIYNNHILSTLYNGTYDSSYEETEKSLHYIANSWLDIEEYRRTRSLGPYRLNGRPQNHPYTIYNASSFAVWSLWSRIRFNQKNGLLPKRIPAWQVQASQ